MICRSPKCSEPAITKRWCSHHQLLFDRLKLELVQEGQRVKGKRRRGGPPVCCRFGCANPRVAPDALCDECVDRGYVEESAA